MIEISNTSRSDLQVIGACIENETTEYLEHFSAFSTYDDLVQIFSEKKRDLFRTIRKEDNICGIYFLRGFDEGFYIPSFGIYIIQKYSRAGLAAFAINDTIKLLEAQGVKRVMLKVANDNSRAYSLYSRKGFRYDRKCSDTGHDILMLQI